MNRRLFISQTAGLALLPAAFANASPGNKSTMVIHHVFFWLKNPGSEADRKLLMQGLQTLRAIPQVKKLLLGTPARTEQRSVVDSTYDVSEMMYFDSAAAQDAYQIDPIHKAFVDKYSSLWAKVVVYDMLVAEG